MELRSLMAKSRILNLNIQASYFKKVSLKTLYNESKKLVKKNRAGSGFGR